MKETGSTTEAGERTQKSAQHTSGPWIVKLPGEHSKDKLRVCHKIGADVSGKDVYGAVADISISRSLYFRGAVSPEELGNARLIAAAPDGYLLIRELRDNEDFDTDDFWDRVEAYLAKTEGRAQ